MNTGSSIKVLIVLGIIALIMFILGKFYSKFKAPKVNCMSLVTGGVKSGKSTFAVYLAIQNYKRSHRVWKIRSYFQKLLQRKVDEEPLLYSNIPLGVPYVKLTDDLITQKKRFRYRSVVYVNEASLLADSQLYKNMEINERLMMFNKLFGHETRGGYIIYDTQAIVDLHYSIKRCISEYFYIHHLEKHIPFLLLAKVREERYSEDGNIINNYNDDIEDSLKKVLMTKRVWKKFDAYCFSFLTDALPVEDRVRNVGNKDLKAQDIVSFRKFVSERFKAVQDGANNNRQSNSNKQGKNPSGEVPHAEQKEVQK